MAILRNNLKHPPVGEVKYPLDPLSAHKEINNDYHGTCLSRTSRHNQEDFALAFLQSFGNTPNRLDLVGASGD